MSFIGILSRGSYSALPFCHSAATSADFSRLFLVRTDLLLCSAEGLVSSSSCINIAVYYPCLCFLACLSYYGLPFRHSAATSGHLLCSAQGLPAFPIVYILLHLIHTFVYRFILPIVYLADNVRALCFCSLLFIAFFF